MLGMALHSALVYSGLIAAIVMLTAAQNRGLAVIAVIAAGLQTLILLGVLSLHVRGIPLGIVFGIALAVPALIAWFRSTGKAAITASAIATFVGLLQLVGFVFPGR